MQLFLTRNGQRPSACQTKERWQVVCCSNLGSLISCFHILALVWFCIRGEPTGLGKVPQEVKLYISIAIEAIFFACIAWISIISSRWPRKKIEQWDVFCFSEERFLYLRILCYIDVILTIVAVCAFQTLCVSKCFGIMMFLHTASVILCIHHAVYRKTFRKWPSFVISLSAGLLYLAILMISYPPRSIFGFLDGQRLISNISQLVTILTSGMIVASLVVLVQTIGKNGLEQVYLSETGLIPDKITNFKRMRLRLLTHLWFFPQSLREFCSSLIMFVIPFLIASSASIICPFLVSTNPPKPSLAFYTGILGVGTFALGTVMHLNVSDEGLLKAEYCYICYQLPSLKKEDIQQRAAKWVDYCQVATNIYCSRSGVISEDEFLHQLWRPALQKLRDKTRACGTQFLADFIQTYHKTYQMYFIPDQKRHPINYSQIAADFVQEFTCRRAPIDYPENHSFGSLLLDAFNCMLEDGRGTWAMRFLKVDLKLNEAIAILFADICDVSIHERSTRSAQCKISDLCGQCREISLSENEETFINRGEFLLSFPIILSECMKNRWGDKVFEPTCWTDFRNYYKRLFMQEKYQSENEQYICDIYERWRHYIQPVVLPVSDLGTCLSGAYDCIIELCDRDRSYRDRGAAAMAARARNKRTPIILPMNEFDRIEALVFYIFYKKST